MQKEKLIKILYFSSFILGISSIIDLALWFIAKFHVPSWTISGLSISFALLSIAFIKVIDR